MKNGEYLKKLIKSKGISHTEFCEELGLSRVAFYDKCNGKYPFRADEIVEAQKILGITDVERDKIFLDKDMNRDERKKRRYDKRNLTA